MFCGLVRRPEPGLWSALWLNQISNAQNSSRIFCQDVRKIIMICDLSTRFNEEGMTRFQRRSPMIHLMIWLRSGDFLSGDFLSGDFLSGDLCTPNQFHCTSVCWINKKCPQKTRKRVHVHSLVRGNFQSYSVALTKAKQGTMVVCIVHPKTIVYHTWKALDCWFVVDANKVTHDWCVHVRIVKHLWVHKVVTWPVDSYRTGPPVVTDAASWWLPNAPLFYAPRYICINNTHNR